MRVHDLFLLSAPQSYPPVAFESLTGGGRTLGTNVISAFLRALLKVGPALFKARNTFSALLILNLRSVLIQRDSNAECRVM